MEIQVQINKSDIDNLAKELKKIGKIVVSPNLQLYRANKYKKYTVGMVMRGELGLEPISEATRIIDEGDHFPEYKTGGLAHKMAVRPVKGNAAEAGFFEGSPKIPGKEITYTQAAILQHTGFRIPLHGDKGARVRAWLAWKGVFEGGASKNKASPDPTWENTSEHWINVSPRPFMLRSYLRFELEGEDTKAVNEYIDKMIASPMSDPNAVDPLKMAGEI